MLNNTPPVDTAAPQLPPEIEQRFTEFYNYGEASVENGGLSITNVKQFIAKELSTQAQLHNQEMRKEIGESIKHYYKVAQHLRKIARDTFMKPTEESDGFYNAIKEIERYFGIESLTTDLGEKGDDDN